jgi:hypothetical protein
MQSGPRARLLRRPEVAPPFSRDLSPTAGIARIARRIGRFASDHRGALILAGILLLAAVPRLWAIIGVGLRGDEAVYAGQAGVLAGDHDLSRYFVLASRGNSNFLLYQEVVALFYLIFGVSDVAARLVAVGFSMGTVLVTFGLAKTLYSRNVGYLAATFVALSGYSVLLGRLALLDSTLVFFFTLSFFCFAKWLTTRRDVWLYGFAAAVALTMQAKVTGVLVLVIALNYLLVSRQLKMLSIRRFLLASLAFIVFFIPVLVQVALKSDQLLQFLSESGARATHVPWYYYLDKMISIDGFVTPLIWLLGIAIALRRWTAGDRLLIFWVFVVALFFQAYPLKAFNYLLPLIPAVSILAGRAVHDVAIALAARLRGTGPLLRRDRRILVGGPASVLAGCAVIAAMALPVLNVVRADSYFGLREAAYWLKANTSPKDGVMTLSKGSAQYALSFYAHRDAYPFGRFRLSTIVPGGVVRNPRPAVDGPSEDWVTYWPPRLIKSGEVSYLVYYTDEGDDPPEAPIVDSDHQERFRRFVESYGGRLVHVVYRNHEGRAWIYKVSKLLARPKITFRPGPSRLKVRGEGFRFNARVTLYYHQSKRGTYKADKNGAFTARIRLPYYVHHRYWLVATDNFGNYASSAGLNPTLRNRRARRRIARNVHPGGRPVAPARPKRTKPSRSALDVKLVMPDAVQVGSELPVTVKVTTKKGSATVPVAQTHLFFQIFSDGRTPVRWRERTTNTLGKSYLHVAALELPGYYKLAVYASKGRHRGIVKRTFKVRRR